MENCISWHLGECDKIDAFDTLCQEATNVQADTENNGGRCFDVCHMMTVCVALKGIEVATSPPN